MQHVKTVRPGSVDYMQKKSYSVSVSVCSTGSMSLPALWASESFTQGLRSMEEVRLPRNLTPHLSVDFLWMGFQKGCLFFNTLRI